MATVAAEMRKAEALGKLRGEEPRQSAGSKRHPPRGAAWSPTSPTTTGTRSRYRVSSDRGVRKREGISPNFTAAEARLMSPSSRQLERLAPHIQALAVSTSLGSDASADRTLRRAAESLTGRVKEGHGLADELLRLQQHQLQFLHAALKLKERVSGSIEGASLHVEVNYFVFIGWRKEGGRGGRSGKDLVRKPIARRRRH